jgi:fluoroacetyl-CoA thioesterase
MLQTGLTREETRTAGPEDSAARVSALVPNVFGSPALLGFAEKVCGDLLAEHISPDETSVGTGFQFTHEAATPIGMKVTVDVRIVDVKGRRVTFEIEGHDEVDRICTGRHERVVVARDKFLQKLEEKAKRAVRE